MSEPEPDITATAPDAVRDPSLRQLEAFSTGVFAFAITLLALSLVVPHLNGSVGALRLTREWPQFLSYILSFILIGLTWNNYQRMVGMIHRPAHWLIWLNILLLMDVAFLPYPTALLGQYALMPGAQLVAALLYGGTLTIGGIFYNAIGWYALSAGLIDPSTPAGEMRQLLRHWTLGPTLYLICTLLAFLNLWISLGGFALLAILYILPPPPISRRSKQVE